MAFLSNPTIFVILSILYFAHPSSARIVDPHDSSETIDEAVLLFNVRDLEKPRCGGIIIGEKHVLTAAHCVVNEGKTNVEEVFEIATSNTLQEKTHSKRKYLSIKEIVIPKDYESAAKGNDIAILVLDQKLFLSNPDDRWLSLSTDASYATDTVQVLGFGIDDEKFFNASVKVSLQDSCGKHLDPKFMNHQMCGLIIDNLIFKGTCKSIDGSGLIYNGAVIGVASRNVLCDTNAISQKYVITSVSSFYETIINTMNGHKYGDGMRCYVYV